MEPVERHRGRRVACSTAPTSTPTRSSPSSSSSGSSAPASASSCSTTGRSEPGWDLLEPNPILAAGPQLRLRLARASTRRGRSRTTASRRHRAVASPTSSTPTAPRSGCCRWCSPRTTCTALMEAGEAADRPRRRRGRAATAGAVPFEIDAGDQAPAARRPRRHRRHAPAARTRSTLRGRARARPVTARSRTAPEPGAPMTRPRLGRRHLRPRLDAAGRVGAAGARAARRCAATRRCSTPAAAPGA